MHGLIITSHKEKDIVKVSFHKEKLLSLAEEEIRNYLQENKNLKKSNDLSALLDALQVKDIESAMDLFGVVTEKNGDPSFLVLIDAEIIYDS